MDVSDEHDAAVKPACAQSAEAVRWASVHRALDAGIETALANAMGEDVSHPNVGFVAAVEALLEEGEDLARPALAVNAISYDPHKP